MERMNGTVNADVKERPDFIIVKKKRDAATGEWVEVESICCPALAQYIREHEHYRFIGTSDPDVTINFWYKDGVYCEVWDDEIKGKIIDVIDAWNPDIVKMRDVNEVYRNLTTDDGHFYDVNADNPEELVVNFKNGLFYPMTNEFKPHTPDLFLTRQLPIDFPLDVLEMDRDTLLLKIPTFTKYMSRFAYGAKRDSLDGMNRYLCVLEFSAIVLSNIPSRRFKKSLWIYGDGDSGKSQLLAFMKYLLGKKNAACTDLKRLESRFGAAAVFNKRLVYSPDQKYINIDELGVFKTLVGAGDDITVERKGKEGFSYEYEGYVWVAANKLPKFGGDNGTQVFNRMILLKAPETVPVAERDSHLLDKLIAEAPYIVAFILRYLPGVVKRGYKITEPDEVEQAREAYAFQNEPVRQWLAECCIKVDSPANDAEADTVEQWRKTDRKPNVKCLYAAYVEWCRRYENGHSLKRNDWKDKLKEILGCPNMLDMPDTEHPEKPSLYMKRQTSGIVIAHWCLNDEALHDFSNWLDK